MGLYTINIEAKVNKKPTAIGNNTIVVNHGATHVFSEANFTTQTVPPYSDPDGDPIKIVQVITTISPGTGDLLYNGSPITNGQEIPMTGIVAGLLTYVSDSGTDTGYNDSFTFDVSDTGSEQFSGLTGTITMSVSAYVNQAPTSGNNSATIAHASTKVFTVADFTTGTTPAYSDPEGDAAQNLRVNSLPANGTLMLSGSPVTVNQIIPMTSISSGNFSYVATRNLTTLRNVTFSFDVSDVGSGQFG